MALAQAGADVAVSDMPSRLDLAGEVKQQIEAGGRRSAVYALDVLDLTNIRETVNQVARDFGGLDIMVNNAGIRIRKPALEITEEEWDAVVDTNLKGVFFCAQAAAKTMIPQGGGRIINIASQLAVVSRPDRAAYCASKAGVANLTRALAQEWTRHGITVNAIGPGPTETPGTLAVETQSEEDAQRVTGGPHAPGPPDATPRTGGRRRLPGQSVGGGDHRPPADGRRRMDRSLNSPAPHNLAGHRPLAGRKW